MNKPIVIGVTGGSGSGKSSVTKRILRNFEDVSIVLMEQDFYYKDQSHMPFEERVTVNYDHPFAFDNDLFVKHIQQLIDGKAIDKPVYDYALHTRSDQVIHVEPREVIVIEGILVLADERLRNLMDIKLYVDTDADLRIVRRIQRDMEKRGRTLQSIIDQYIQVVKTMHDQFIEPSKRYADLIIPEGGHNHVAIDLMTTKIQHTLQENRH